LTKFHLYVFQPYENMSLRKETTVRSSNGSPRDMALKTHWVVNPSAFTHYGSE
jgi:hypothetical protein